MKFIIKYLIHSLALYLRLPIHYLYVYFIQFEKSAIILYYTKTMKV